MSSNDRDANVITGCKKNDIQIGSEIFLLKIMVMVYLVSYIKNSHALTGAMNTYKGQTFFIFYVHSGVLPSFFSKLKKF